MDLPPNLRTVRRYVEDSCSAEPSVTGLFSQLFLSIVCHAFRSLVTLVGLGQGVYFNPLLPPGWRPAQKLEHLSLLEKAGWLAGPQPASQLLK